MGMVQCLQYLEFEVLYIQTGKQMKLFLLTFTLFLLPLQARMYLEFSIDDATELKQLDEALRLGLKLKSSLKTLRQNSPNNKNIQVLEKQLAQFEEQMFKSYGMIPGLTYLTVATSGTIFMLVPENKVAEYVKEGITVAAGTPTVTVKDSKGNDVRCFKISVKKLITRDSVMAFNQTLQAAESIRIQLKSLGTQLEKKPELKKDPKIVDAIKKLKATLEKFDSELLKKFEVKSGFKYTFEPATGAVYLKISESDLLKLGKMKKEESKSAD